MRHHGLLNRIFGSRQYSVKDMWTENLLISDHTLTKKKNRIRWSTGLCSFTLSCYQKYIVFSSPRNVPPHPVCWKARRGAAACAPRSLFAPDWELKGRREWGMCEGKRAGRRWDAVPSRIAAILYSTCLTESHRGVKGQLLTFILFLLLRTQSLRVIFFVN